MATYNPPTTGASAGSTGMVGDESTKTGGGVTGAIGSGLERAGDYLEEKGKAEFVANRLHNAGRYLQQHDARTIAREVDAAICAHPYRSMFVGLGVGWFVGRFFSR